MSVIRWKTHYIYTNFGWIIFHCPQLPHNLYFFALRNVSKNLRIHEIQFLGFEFSIALKSLSCIETFLTSIFLHKEMVCWQLNLDKILHLIGRSSDCESFSHFSLNNWTPFCSASVHCVVYNMLCKQCVLYIC